MSQRTKVLQWLEQGKSITPLVALREFGALRLGARIYELRRRGYRIDNQWETDGRKRWARYRLVGGRKVA